MGHLTRKIVPDITYHVFGGTLNPAHLNSHLLSSQIISRAFVNGSVPEHVVDFDLQSPEGVVVDWVAHNLYWVDSGTRRVEMSHVDGSSRRVIVWQNVQPRSLAVDPTHG